MALILGIDPGSRVTGFGVIHVEGRVHRYVACGTIKATAEKFADRLATIFRGVTEVINEYRPELMAIEQVFMHQNASAALKLGQARGAAIVAGVNQALPVHEYSPRSIKQAVVGHGGADKAQVQHMMKALLSIHEPMAEDAADALAVALCHSHTAQGLAALYKACKTG